MKIEKAIYICIALLLAAALFLSGWYAAQTFDSKNPVVETIPTEAVTETTEPENKHSICFLPESKFT